MSAVGTNEVATTYTTVLKVQILIFTTHVCAKPKLFPQYNFQNASLCSSCITVCVFAVTNCPLSDITVQIPRVPQFYVTPKQYTL